MRVRALPVHARNYAQRSLARSGAEPLEEDLAHVAAAVESHVDHESVPLDLLAEPRNPEAQQDLKVC